MSERWEKIEAARAEYGRVVAPAYAEYERVAGPARADYLKVEAIAYVALHRRLAEIDKQGKEEGDESMA